MIVAHSDLASSAKESRSKQSASRGRIKVRRTSTAILERRLWMSKETIKCKFWRRELKIIALKPGEDESSVFEVLNAAFKKGGYF